MYVAGVTGGALAGNLQDEADAWVGKFDTSGKVVWKRQLGTATYDYAIDVATDTKNNVYIAGGTEYYTGIGEQFGRELWVAKYTQ